MSRFIASPQPAPKARGKGPVACPVCSGAGHFAIPASAFQIGPARALLGALPAHVIVCAACEGSGIAEGNGPLGAHSGRVVAFRPRAIDIAA